MAITAAMVKELREMTGAGMMDCKKALSATDGDMDKSIEWLREKGLATAQKKAGRIAAEGIVMLAADDAQKKAVAVEVKFSDSGFIGRACGDPDGTDRFFRRAAARSGDPGNGNGAIGLKIIASPQSHFKGDLFADCSVFFKGFSGNAEHGTFEFIAVNDGTSFEYRGDPRKIGQNRPDTASCTGFGGNELKIFLLQYGGEVYGYYTLRVQ